MLRKLTELNGINGILNFYVLSKNRKIKVWKRTWEVSDHKLKSWEMSEICPRLRLLITCIFYEMLREFLILKIHMN